MLKKQRCDIMSKVAIFIDYDNVSITLDKYYQNSNRPNLKLDIIHKIKDFFKNDKILTIKAFADFEKITPLLTPLQKEQVELRHVYSSSKRKNASDIALVISVMKSIYSNQNIDKYVIVSSDSDMLPVINEMKFFDKDIFVVYSEYCAKNEYNTYLDADSFITIEKLLGIPVYSPIQQDTILSILPSILKMINKNICETYFKYKGEGTVLKKDIINQMYSTYTLYCSSDIDIIVDYLFKNKLLIESCTQNPMYKKVLINAKLLSEYSIQIEERIISEGDYKKI